MTFEGPEGAGKSTQVELLRAALDGLGQDPVVVREPGGTPLGEAIRDLLLHGPGMSADAEKHLFMAARAELLAEVILPALAAGRHVLADRYHDSTLAYQGGGRRAAVDWPPEFPRPDLTFLLALPAEDGLARHARGGRAADRLEAEKMEFHKAVAVAYDRLAESDPNRIVRLDARLPAAAVHIQVLDRVKALRDGRIRSSS